MRRHVASLDQMSKTVGRFGGLRQACRRVDDRQRDAARRERSQSGRQLPRHDGFHTETLVVAVLGPGGERLLRVHIDEENGFTVGLGLDREGRRQGALTGTPLLCDQGNGAHGRPLGARRI